MPKKIVVDYILEQKDGQIAFVGQSAKTGKTIKLSKVMLRLSPEAVTVLVDDLLTIAGALVVGHTGDVNIGVPGDTTHLTGTFAKYKNKNPFPNPNRTALADNPASWAANLGELLAAALGIDGSRLSSDVRQKPRDPVKGPQPAG